eukprot:2789766-Rhodomonas_salina.9
MQHASGTVQSQSTWTPYTLTMSKLRNPTAIVASAMICHAHARYLSARRRTARGARYMRPAQGAG